MITFLIGVLVGFGLAVVAGFLVMWSATTREDDAHEA